MRKDIHCTVNGMEREFNVDVRSSLLEMLRGEEHAHSVKKGCEVGECGACTVLIDGRPFVSCIYLAIWAEGKDIMTSEGLVDKTGKLSDIQEAFISEGAVQCGFCTRGSLCRPFRSSTPTESTPGTRSRNGSPATSAAVPDTRRS